MIAHIGPQEHPITTNQRKYSIMAKRFEIINHGIDTPSYFPGVGTSHSSFNSVVTGVGMNAKDAYLDAIDAMYTMHESHQIERLHLPTRPSGIRQTDSIGKEYAGASGDEPSEFHWFVSIRYSI